MRKIRFMAVIAIVLLTAMMSLQAQTPALVLTRGSGATATLGNETLAQVYFFVALEGEIISLAGEGTDGLNIGLLLTDKAGATLAQAVPNEAGQANISNLAIPATDNYFVTVFAVSGTGTYTVALSGDITSTVPDETATEEATAVTEDAASVQFGVVPTPVGQQATTTGTSTAENFKVHTAESPILLANGLEVRLEWTAAVDLNLEVRDPIGNTLYFDQRTTNNGGTFGFDANGFCQIITPNPVETATWTPGFLPVGNYEILVFYRQACQTAEAVQFNIVVTADGVTLPPVQGTLNPPLSDTQSVYLSSFRVLSDGSALTAQGGAYPDTAINQLTAPFSEVQANARLVTPGSVARGAVVEDQYYLSYRFTALENDLVTVSLDSDSGNLDTLLQVVDSNGNLIAVNDDANNTRNSQVQNLRLATAGDYYIVATRYGKEFGGTEGNFQLNVQGGVATVPSEVQALNLAPADIQIVLTWATPADLQLLVRDPIGDSVFDDAPSVASGGQLALAGNVNCVAATTGVPASYVVWPSGFLRPGSYEIEVWYQSACNTTIVPEFTLTVLVRGQIVTVERQRPQLNQRYVLSFIINPDNTVIPRLGGYAANDAQALDYQSRVATPTSFNQSLIGTITNDNVFDAYSFQGVAGQSVTVSMASTTTTLDTKLVLLAPSGIQVAENDDSGAGSITGRRSDALIGNYILTESGEYKIVATRYATLFGGTIGGYSLTVQGN